MLPLPLVRVEFVHDEVEIAVIFGSELEAEVVVARTEHDDEIRQRRGEIPSASISGVEGL
jgi:hypothetical protein